MGGRCDKYPLVEDTTEISELLDKLFPPTILGGNVVDTIQQINNTVMKLSTESNLWYYIEKIIQAGASIGAAAGTAGAGGDMAVSLIFTIRHGVDMASRVVNTVFRFRDIVFEEREEGMGVSTETVRFLGDLFNIDFRDGPDGVDCWVGQMFKQYNMDNMNVVICQLLNETRIYQKMTEFVGNFIGSMIPDAGFLVSSFIIKFMSSNFGKRSMMRTIIKMLKKKYKKIPKSVRLIIQDPNKLDAFVLDSYSNFRKAFGITEKIKEPLVSEDQPPLPDENTEQIPAEQTLEQTLEQPTEGGGLISMAMKRTKKMGKRALKVAGLVGRLTGTNEMIISKMDQLMQQFIIPYSKIVAYTLHKMLALTFALLYIFEKCPLE